MSDINSRLERLEAMAGEITDDETEFHKFCTGEYDHSMSLEENLRAAELPPGATPSTALRETPGMG